MGKQVQISCAVIAQLISTFVFTSTIFLFYVNPKFQGASFVLRLHVRFVSDLVGNPEDWFSVARLIFKPSCLQDR